MNFKRGSEWRQWDLHLHTPSSYDYHDKSITNEQIISSLKENEIKAVAITDHNVIDTQRIMDLKAIAGEDIVIFPGIELRSELGGSESIHYICIFPECSNLENIKIKFLGKLNLTEDDIKAKGGHEKVYIHLNEAVEVVRELGGIVTIHAGKKSNSLENITSKLPEKAALKTEIFNNIDMYEVGSVKDIEDYKKKVFPVLKREIATIICSDNHDIKKYARAEKLWIKANLTIEGLKQAIKEQGSRIYVGEEPTKQVIVNENNNRFIDKITIVGKSEDDKWFNSEIYLNTDLVTIIGNKGNGKSALADIIGYAGNTKNARFSFLNTERFNKKPDELGRNYTVKLSWKNGVEQEKDLFVTNESLIENVKYLPQQYIESVCNDLDDGFKSEVDRLIFDYLPKEEKLEQRNFKELIEFVTRDLVIDIINKKSKLEEINTNILSKEDLITEEKKSQAILFIQTKSKELQLEIEKKPAEVKKPNIDPEIQKKLLELNDQRSHFNELLELKEILLNNLTKRKHVVNETIQKIDKAKQSVDVWKNNINTSLSNEDISIGISAELKVEDLELRMYNEQLEKDIISLKQSVSTENSYLNSDNLNVKIKLIDEELKGIKSSLSEAQVKYQKYLEDLNKWEIKIANFSKEIKDLQFNLKAIEEEIPEQIDKLRSERKVICNEIYDLKVLIKNKYFEKYKYVKSRIDELKIVEHERPNFTIDFNLEKEIFIDGLLNNINQNIKSIFRGKEQGREELSKLIEGINLNDFDNIYSILTTIENKLKESSVEYNKVFLNKVNFFNNLFLLDYISISYNLNLGEKHMLQLSPGEKGLLLLVFYLILDKDNSPLIIDQPEDNLDNQSIFQNLVNYIKEAKERRQIIIVTHNPNIAIACDSEQVIYSSMNKKNRDISYISGSLEDKNTNKYVVDILEGTQPAFDKRRDTYFS